MTTATELQKTRNAEGRELAREHEAARSKVEGKIEAANAAAMKAGKSNDRVIGAGKPKGK